MRNHFFRFLTFLALVFIASQTQASILKKASTKEMTRQAKQVQVGEVVSTWTSPEPDQKMYFTYVKIRVEKTLKGKQTEEILLRQPGGSYHDPVTGKITRQKVFGMEEFQKGERAVFFITEANDSAPTVMFHGKHQIVKDAATGEEMTVQNAEEEDDDEDGNHSHKKSLYAVHERKPLKAMMVEIQDAVNEEKRRP